PGHVDVFLAKYDSMGAILWAKHFGSGTAGDNSFVQNALAVAPGDDIFLAGFFENTIDLGGGALQGAPEGAFVAPFDTAGNHSWSKAVPASGTAGDGLAFLASQDAVLYGSFVGTISFDGAFGNQQYIANDYDLYVTRFKPGP